MTEVRGFTDLQKEEYFRKRVIDRGLADRIISHVKDSRTLEIMCHIPIFCWITATVLEHMLRDGHDNVPSSLTELYTRFLLTQTSVKRRNLQERNIVFTEEDLMEYGVDVTEASLKSGVFTEIVKEEDPMFPAKHYSFVHLSFQEYLAAVFVLHAYAENGENVIQSGFGLGFLLRLFQPKVTLYDFHRCAIDEALKSPSGHLDLFLRFLLGLSLESNQKLLKSFSKNLGSGQEDSQRTVQYLLDKLDFILGKMH
ncbi:hypothetical protein NFI96_018642 [Prochilodus magdalenae]|nr:hypothetical protein NFI96_018642 [Prochilodus magdalenae]